MSPSSELVADRNLPLCKQLIRVRANGGVITLQGRVNSEKEKAAIERKATEIAGKGNVINQLTIKQELL